MKQGLKRVLAAGQLLRVVTSQSLSTLANQILSFVIPWIILNQTGSAFDAGAAAFAIGAAAFLGTLFSGLAVDRWGGRLTSIVADILSALTILALPVAIIFDFLPIWFIVVTQTLGALFNGPGDGAKDALVKPTAKADNIPLIRAASLQESLQGAATFVGPLSAGLMIAILSESLTLTVTAGVLLLCVLLIAGTKRQKLQHDQPLTIRQMYRDMREGVLFLYREPLLWPLTIYTAIVIGIFMPLVIIVFPAWFVFAEQGADALGIFLGAQALGSIVGAMGFAIIATKVSSYKWFMFAMGMSTLGIFALAFVQPGTFLAIVISFASGLTWAGVMPIMNTAFYSRIPQQLFGRVNGVAWAAMLMLYPITSLLAGWLVSMTSAVTGIVVISIGLGLSVVAFLFIPAMKLLDEHVEA